MAFLGRGLLLGKSYTLPQKRAESEKRRVGHGFCFRLASAASVQFCTVNTDVFLSGGNPRGLQNTGNITSVFDSAHTATTPRITVCTADTVDSLLQIYRGSFVETLYITRTCRFVPVLHMSHIEQGPHRDSISVFILTFNNYYIPFTLLL